MRWDSSGEEKKGEKRKNQGRGKGETMGLAEGWKEKREGRTIGEGRWDKNEFLFHPE